MFGQTFYHGHLKKYVTLFGTLFNDIYITRTATDAQQTLKVPISYGPRDKMLARVEADADLTRPFAIQLPRMSFELTALTYAPTRKLGSIRKGHMKRDEKDPDRLKYVYNPVPYDINFTLHIATKNTEDGTKILEQILPYFTPEWTITINLIPELDIKLDIPTTLLNVTSEDTYDSDFVSRRALIWQLDFIMKGYVFGPVKKSNVIKFANTNLYTSNNTLLLPEERVTVAPGLLANGSPTSNASLSIDRDLIEPDDNYGYIITYEEIDNE